MKVNESHHLPKLVQMQLGSFYTPKQLVDRVHEFIAPYLEQRKKDVVVFDSAGGCGAFMESLGGCDYRVAECDQKAYSFLLERYNAKKVFHTNSLIEVSREKYLLENSAFLIMIGNPPYNDTTSEYRNGEKGNNVCDKDIYDRDLGISFLRSYDKLQANVVCILHPLSYLIKRSNFERLGNFRHDYRLEKAEIFSSALFSGTGAFKFPIVVAMYKRQMGGMSFEHILNFDFKVLGSDKRFVLKNFRTTDGYIHKYPPRIDSTLKSPIGLYYYTFRDINSVKRNRTFMTEEHPNGVVVTVENLYKYCYLYALKHLFSPEDLWLYGNLSPLVDKNDLELHKNLYLSYAMKTDGALKRLSTEIVRRIEKYYQIDLHEDNRCQDIETNIKVKFARLLNKMTDQ